MSVGVAANMVSAPFGSLHMGGKEVLVGAATFLGSDVLALLGSLHCGVGCQLVWPPSESIDIVSGLG